MGRSSEHFDLTAATYDDPTKERRAAEIAAAIGAALPLRPGLRVLEYGAGTGLVARALTGLQEAMALTLADNSDGMRAVLDSKIQDGRLPAGTRVLALDLEQEEPPAERFDLVVSSLVLHHVPDLDRVLAGFATLLDDGGHVAIADLDQEDGSFHAHLHDFDGHSGFDRGALTEALGRAGLTDVSVADCTEIDRDGTPYPVFLATARRTGAGQDDLKATLLRYLRRARQAMVWKLDGLSEYDVRRPLTPTGTNLLGLVKHLASVELGYLGDTFGRPSGIPLPWYDDGAEDDADLWATPEESREEVLGLYRRAWEHGDATVAALDLDSPGWVEHWGDKGGTTLGAILVHLVDETARHAGHADILREGLDGAAGLREGGTNLPDRDGGSWSEHRDRVEAAARAAAEAAGETP